MAVSPKKYGVIGNPIGHSKSPLIHQAFARQTGIELSYAAILAPLDEFVATVTQFRQEGGRGLNVTVPFKHEAYAYCAELSDRARQAGAVNTLIFPEDDEAPVRGDNTDGVGLMRDLSYHDIPVKGRRVLLIGAGGAARGVLGPLCAAEPAEIRVANRRSETAVQLIRDYAEHEHVQASVMLRACALDQFPEDEQPFDLIINATSASLGGQRPAVPDTVFSPHTIAYDMAYGSEPTVFMTWAESLGARALDGLGMLVEQAAESFYQWHGVQPKTDEVRALLRHTLVNR